MRSPCDCRTMTAQYPCHFTGTARASCGDLAIAVRGPYDHHKSQRSSCDFLFQNDQQKPCVLRTIDVRPPCNARTGIVQGSYDVSTGYVSTILNVLYNSELNKIVEATTTLRHPKTVRYRTITVRRSHENGNLGIVRSP